VQVPTSQIEIRDDVPYALRAAGAVVRCLGLAFSLTLVPALNDGTAHGAEAPREATSFTVESPRALSEAVLILIQRYGYVITYEDAPLAYTGDLQDLTSERHGDLSYLKKRGAVRETVPLSETLTVNLPAPSDMNDPKNVAAVIEQMLMDHANHNQGGHFRLQQTEGYFHIVPSEVRDSHGEWVSHGSILEANISMPELEGPGAVLLDAICAAVGNATHTQVVVGSIPNNVLIPYRGVVSARSEPARVVLLRMLKDTERRLTWMLEYDASRGQYILSIVLVPDRAAPAAPSQSTPSAAVRLWPGPEVHRRGVVMSDTDSVRSFFVFVFLPRS
jgi:hypothetical protein